jgi:hypothetical protein
MRKLNAVVLTILAVTTVTATSSTAAFAAAAAPVAAVHTVSGIRSDADTGWGNGCPPPGEPVSAPLPPNCPPFPLHP